MVEDLFNHVGVELVVGNGVPYRLREGPPPDAQNYIGAVTPGQGVHIRADVVQNLISKVGGGASHHSRNCFVKIVGFLWAELLNYCLL